MKITVSSALKQVGTFFIKLCRDYCEKQKKARIEKEKQAERDATVKMLTLWLAYLNHDKALKLYRGLKPDIHTKKISSLCCSIRVWRQSRRREIMPLSAGAAGLTS